MALATPSSEPPVLRTIEHVIPVAQTQERAGWQITCISAEVYDDGFRVTFRVYGSGKPPNPELTLRVRDDHGNDYRPWSGGGNGEPTTGACDWRLSFACAPKLDPTSRQLSIAVDELNSAECDPVQHRLVAKQADRGPWTFVVALT